MLRALGVAACSVAVACGGGGGGSGAGSGGSGGGSGSGGGGGSAGGTTWTDHKLWAEKFGGDDVDFPTGIERAPDGTFWISGRYSGSVSFGGADLPSPGGGFIAHFSADGAHLYSAAEPGLPRVAVAASGNVIVGSNELDTAELRVRDPAGTLLSSFAFSGSGSAQISAVAAGQASDAVVLGEFQGDLLIGSSQLSSLFGSRTFVASIASGGTPAWAMQIDGEFAKLLDAVVDANGNVFVVGESGSAFSLAGQTMEQHRPFVTMLTSDGAVAWARSFPGVESVASVTLADDGHPIVFGDTQEIADVDTGPFPEAYGVFAASLDTDGTTRWAWQIAASGLEAYELTTDPSGDSFVVGRVSGETTILGETYSTKSSHPGAPFVARVTASGEVQWVNFVTSNEQTEWLGMVSLPEAVVVSGRFEQLLAFDDEEFRSDSYSQDIFVAGFGH